MMAGFSIGLHRMHMAGPNAAISRRCAVIGAALAVALVVGEAPSRAQTITGPFEHFNSWWIHPTLGTSGLSRDADNISIDRDGDGSTETTYDIPDLGTQAFPVNIFLSPTREILVAFGGACPTGGSPVFFFDTTSPPNLPVIDSACIENGISTIGFYDTGLCEPTGVGGLGLDCTDDLGVSPQRIAYVQDSSFIGRIQVYWFDLVNGTHVNTFPGFNRSLDLQRIRVSPYGDVAYVHHGITTTTPVTSDYSLIDLCPSPRLGDPISSNVGGELFDIPGAVAATAEMMESGGDFFIRVTHPSLTGGEEDFNWSPCSGPPPPGDDIGACCFTDGTCDEETLLECDADNGFWLGPGSDCSSCDLPGACCLTTSCLAFITESECNLFPGATWLGGLSTCLTCDVLDLDITKTGPASVIEGTELEYTLTYSNVGDLDASAMTVTDVIPVGSTFVSAGQGGTYNASNRTVTWMVPGPLTPGNSGQVTLRVRANCGSTSLTNFDYRITSSGAPFFGAPSVITTVNPASALAATITVQSIPARVPLQRGDLITHTITLTESAGVARTGANFFLNLGPNVSFDALQNNGGGTVSVIGSSLTWMGNLAANSMLDVMFTTLVNDCTSGFPAVAQLNSGAPISLRNSCGVILSSSAPPTPIDIIQPIRPSMEALPPIGPPQFNSIGLSNTQVARLGSSFDVQITLTNQLPADQPNVSITVPLPAGLSVLMDPPFISPTAPGAGYNAGTETISWMGSIPGNSSVQITYTVMQDDPTVCRAVTFLDGQTGVCDDLSFSHTMLFVLEPPAESHLLGLAANSGAFANLWTYRPGIDMVRQQLMCWLHEINFSFMRTPGGEIWVMGLPMFRINPSTLEFEIFRDDLAESFGITPFGFLTSAAYDPSDNAVLMAGTNQGIGSGQLRIVRYNPMLGNSTMLFNGATLSPQVSGDGRAGLIVDAEGRVATLAFVQGGVSGIIRVDPANPAAYQQFVVPGLSFPIGFGGSNDGNYLVANFAFGGEAPAIARVDRITGLATILVPNLQTFLPGVQYASALTQAPDGTIYAAAYFPAGTHQLVSISLDPAPMLSVIQFGGATDLEWVDLGTPPPPIPGDIDGDGDIDNDDFDRFGDAFGSTSADANYDPDADMDGDGDVDCADLRLFRDAWPNPPFPPFNQCRPNLGSGGVRPASAASPAGDGCSNGLLPVMGFGLAPLWLVGKAMCRRRRRPFRDRPD